MRQEIGVLIREVEGGCEARLKLLQQVTSDLACRIAEVGVQVAQALVDGHAVYTIGNGGSAAQAQHLAAELVGRFVRERPALRALALTADSSLLTAIGNDYGFDAIFERQVQAHVQPGDILICLSTSGNSRNVITAAREARRRGVLTVAVVGGRGGALVKETDMAVVVATTDTAQIQEVHLMICHLLCSVIEECLQARGES